MHVSIHVHFFESEVQNSCGAIWNKTLGTYWIRSNDQNISGSKDQIDCCDQNIIGRQNIIKRILFDIGSKLFDAQAGTHIPRARSLYHTHFLTPKNVLIIDVHQNLFALHSIC